MKIILVRVFTILGILLLVLGIVILTFMAFALKYNGIWKMEAYGLCFRMNAGFVRSYEVTDHYYARMKAYDGVIINGILYCGLGKFTLDKEHDQLKLIDKGSQVNYLSEKMNKSFFENLCKVTSEDQIAKANMFYETLKENYAFADLYQVDIDKEYNKYSSAISADMTELQLYQFMCNMVTKLNDGHINVSFQDNEFCPSSYKPEWITDKAEQQLLGSVITDQYVQDYYKFKDCYIRYGTLREDIGYIIIQGIGMEELNKSASTKKAMDKIIKQFQDKKTIVIDLRFCGGGFDEASLLLAGYFTHAPYLAYQKQAYYKGSYTDLQSIYVKPNDLYYNGKIVLLVSGYTISAAETFSRALLANPDNQVTTVGQKTAGYYSDSIPRQLPGGLGFAMSTERYFWYEGSMLEGNGINPMVDIPVDIRDAAKGIDEALDWVLNNY